MLQLQHQILDAGGRDRVERRARLVHQDHVRLDCQAARDAEALLLSARELIRVLLQAVLDLVPQRSPLQRPLDDAVHVALHPDHARPEGDVVVDRLRERVRLLEHHPDQLAYLDGVDAGPVEVLAVVEDRAFDRRGRDQVVHPVEAADQGALPAARRPDQGRDAVVADIERDVAHGRIAVVADARRSGPRRSAQRAPAARAGLPRLHLAWSGVRCRAAGGGLFLGFHHLFSRHVYHLR